MMKRTLSFVLCLIMVLGLAAPSVQASSTDNNSSTSDILDGIYIPEGADGTVIIDGEDVTDEVKNNSDKLPSPTELVTEPTTPSAPVAVEGCQCADLASAVEHGGVCLAKAPFMELCEKSAQDICALWGIYTLEEQTFMLEYLQTNAPVKYECLEMLLSAPTGSASETLTDGNTVSVQGIPQDGSLTVGEAADEVKDIVDAYVAEKEDSASQLFAYDVSVQDGEGADWQPETTVKMELELPGEKLHKNTQVYVVHVDDEGNATTIEAEVTEDGKIAFETPGFSAFYGFTVDFHYEDAVFSIPGMSSIKLSELFEELKMPLNAEDVVALDYTDDTQLKIEQLEGDWLLTSLKAFSTEEKLTMTMADGAVYEIKVTDLEVNGSGTWTWQLYNGYFGSYNHVYCEDRFPLSDSSSTTYDSVFNASSKFGTVNIRGNSSNGTYTWQTSNDSTRADYLYFDYENQNVTITIEPGMANPQKFGDKLYVDMFAQYQINNGANVTIQLSSKFDSLSVTEVVFKSWQPTWTMFYIKNGSLTLKGTEHTKIVLDFDVGTDGNADNTAYPLIWEDGAEDDAPDAARSLTLENVTFRNSKKAAIELKDSRMTNITLTNCTFENTVRNNVADTSTATGVANNNDGGMIVIRDTGRDITKFEMTNCHFYGVSGTKTSGNRGGAISIEKNISNLSFTKCTFTNISAPNHGGAICLNKISDGAITIGSVLLSECTFTGCSSAGRGGALRMIASNATAVTVTDCTFDTCTAGTHGGALSFQGNLGSLTINETEADKSKFVNCSGNANGGTIAAQIPITNMATSWSISDTTFEDCSTPQSGGAIWHSMWTNDFDITDCTFTGCEAQVYGGAIDLIGKTGTADITGCSFTDCKAGQVTSPLYEKDADGNNTTTPLKDKNGNAMYNGSGGGGAICIAENHGEIRIAGTKTGSTINYSTFSNCESLNNGGAIDLEGSSSTTYNITKLTIEYVDINGCTARDSGTAMCFGTLNVKTMNIQNSLIQNCSYVKGYTGTDALKNTLYQEDVDAGKEYLNIAFRSDDSSGTIRTTGAFKCQATVENVRFYNNVSATGGGGIYWNANRVSDDVKDTTVASTFTASLDIKSCEFESNQALRDGGAIYVEASLTVEGGTFKYNKAERGGAIAQQIYNNSGRPIQSGESNNLIIKKNASGVGATFEENYARNHGGAISVRCNATASIAPTVTLAYPITIQMTGATLQNNRAGENGGGIFFQQLTYTAGSDDQREVENYQKSLTMTGCTVSDNYAGCGWNTTNLLPNTAAAANGSGHGGGVYLEAEKNTTLTIQGGKINSNTARDGNGGGVYMTGTNGVCNIQKDGEEAPTIGESGKGNKATSPSGDQNKGNGGGLGIFHGATINLQFGNVSYNEAATSGGGIAVNDSKMTATNGTVSNNKATYGGGISLTNSGTPSTIADESLETPPVLTADWGMVFTNGTVSNNLAMIGGGICVSNSSTMKLEGGSVEYNYAATAKNTNESSYPAGYNGGGIAVVAGSKMNIYGGGIKYNNASNGGGVAVQGGSALQMLPKSGSTAAGTVSNNTAKRLDNANGYGGGVYLKDADSTSVQNTFYIKGGTVSSNSAYDGAGLNVREYCKATFSGGSISSNEATHHGGGAYASGATLTVSGANIDNNKGPTSGGGIYACKGGSGVTSSITISDGKIFSNETANGWGGGIYVLGSGGSLTITGGEIYSNKVLGTNCCGGAINVESSITVNIEGGEIYGNEAKLGYGGGIHSYRWCTINVKGGVIRDNEAAYGGGIALRKGSAATVTTSTDGKTVGSISGNTANRGGGIYVNEGGKLTANNGYIINNKATGTPTDKTIKTGYYKDNGLKGVGGGIYIADGSADYGASTFTLTGSKIAIYGNLADFAADDVFANANNTKLAVPPVTRMSLADFDINPEGWVEDYVKGDSSYETYGLRMLYENNAASKVPERFRSASSSVQPAMLINSTYLATDTGVNAPNTYVCMTLGIPNAYKDVVVMDYVRRISINIWKNDLFLSKTDTNNEFGIYVDPEEEDEYLPAGQGSFLLKKLPTGEDIKETNGIHYSKISDTVWKNVGEDREEIKTKYAQSSHTGDGIVDYRPSTSNITTEDTFYYAVAHNQYWYYGQVTVIPATTLYIEDNARHYNHPLSTDPYYITYHTTEESPYHNRTDTEAVTDKTGNKYNVNLATWEEVKPTDYNWRDHNEQDTDRPGAADILDIDADNVYGYDSNYESYTTFSGDTARKAVVTRTVSFVEENGRKWRVEDQTAARASFTFKGTGFDVVSLCSDKSATVLVLVYRGAVDDFDTTTNELVDIQLVDTYYSGSETFYQVPVIKSSGLDYDTYSVEIYVSPGIIKGEDTHYEAEFYLDAIRVYDPAGFGGNSQTIQDAYKADGEGWPIYEELRNMIIGQDRLTDNPTEGAVFIDANGTPTLEDYVTYGPNNELYLAAGKSIAFRLNALNYIDEIKNATSQDFDTDLVQSVHLGVRGLTGNGKVLIYDDKGKVLTLNDLGSTDMYYDISSMVNNLVTIKNEGSTPIALSTIKITHSQNPYEATASSSWSAGGIITIDGTDAQLALDILNPDQLVDPVVKPKYPALSFNGMVCYNVFFTAEDLGNLTAEDLGLAVFDSYDAEGTVETAKDVIMGATEVDGLYMVATNGVHAKFLGDTQYFRAFAKKADGTYVYSKMVSYSALDYAKSVLTSSEDVKLKQLVVAMLNYGAEAQKFFDYKTDDLMNKDLTADDLALLAGYDAGSLNTVGKVDPAKVGEFASTGGFTRRAPAISFKGAFEINYFFTPANYADRGQMYLYFWNEDTYNSVDELTAENADKVVLMTEENGTFTATSDEIIAKYLDKTVYVAAVYESSGMAYCSGVLPYSIAAYCQNPPADVQDLATAAAIYGCTAKEFFNV